MYLSVYYGNVGILGAFNNTLAGWPIMIWVGVLLVYSYIASVLPVWVLLQPRDYINSLQLLSALALVVAGLVIAGLIGGAPIASAGGRTPLEIVAPAFRMAPEGLRSYSRSSLLQSLVEPYRVFTVWYPAEHLPSRLNAKRMLNWLDTDPCLRKGSLRCWLYWPASRV